MYKNIFEVFLSNWESLILLFSFCVFGGIEGVIEAYLKHLDNRSGQTVPQVVSSAFWTKQKLYRFSYKCFRLLIVFGIISVSFFAGLKVTGAIMSGGFGNILWQYAILIPSFKMYKVFTKVMSDVENKTDEAGKEATKLFKSGYNTAFAMYERIKDLNSVTTENTDKKEDSTNDEDNENK